MSDKHQSREQELTDLVCKSLEGKVPKYKLRADVFSKMGNFQTRIKIYRDLQDPDLKKQVMDYILGEMPETKGSILNSLSKIDENEEVYFLYEITQNKPELAAKAIEILFKRTSPIACYFQTKILAGTGNENDTDTAWDIAGNPEAYGLTEEQAEDIKKILGNSKD